MAPDCVGAEVEAMLPAAGGVLLVTHAHTAFEGKSSYLVQVTHVAMGALALVLAAARLLELRTTGSLRRAAGTVSGVSMLLIALVLIFYREANLVIPDDPTAAADVAKEASRVATTP